MADSHALVIVESPAKARTIAGFLGDGYVVESSIGHIRDLPRNAADIPATHKKLPWARLGVDVDAGFKPLYVVDPAKREHIARLRKLTAEAHTIYLATDEDREGESIAWHLLEVLKPKVPVKRMVFHEITKSAIQRSVESPRELDRRLVEAQEARRILDRLYGYEVSPVLWKKVLPRLSAGRVQSVATRIVVERELERVQFRAASYWDVEGSFLAPESFSAQLIEVDGTRIASGKEFDDRGQLKRADVRWLKEPEAQQLARELADATFTVTSVERKPQRRSPAPPFMTSTLQQEAGRKLKFSSARTMRAAQRLYERGYITYMRTDSTVLSEAAVGSARQQIRERYGDAYVPSAPRQYTKKVKNAQEAHEAIRPAGTSFRLPEEVAPEVEIDEARLYELIWMRTIASQMPDAQLEGLSVRIAGVTTQGRNTLFSVSGNSITFPGYLRAYVEGSDDPSAELETRERPLPALKEGQKVGVAGLEAKGHETSPPVRYTEASLVRRLEELGVGRPSTYASILGTILDRGYVWKKGMALVPSYVAFAVIGLLKDHFSDLVDFGFTARMEDDLDGIARGAGEMVPWLTRFYFGGDESEAGSEAFRYGLRRLVADRLERIDARLVNSLPLGIDDQGRQLIVRVGKYGAYLQRGEDTVTIPEGIAPDELTVEKATELLAAPSGDRALGNDPVSGQPVLLRVGRFGAYVQLGEASDGEKPRTSSLLSNQSPDSVGLEEALRLLSLPRTVGIDPGTKEPVVAQLGRYGAYVSKGKESRSLASEEQVFTVTLEEALVVLQQPRTRQRKEAAGPLREIGPDQVSGKGITLREGRFGLYVTDGETNASLRKQDNPETLTLERAQELLQLRRDAGPSTKKTTKKRAATPAGEGKVTKTAAAKKTTAKKTTTKKATAKKTTATKTATSKKAASKKTPETAAE